MSEIIKQEASKELEKWKARRALIRQAEDGEALLLYIDTVFRYHYKKVFRQTWWDPILAQALMDIYWGVIDRLSISMPPRHGKTERVVRQFGSYVQGLNSRLKLQYGTYSSTLSIDTAVDTKGIMESTIYKEIFADLDFNNSMNLKEHWKLKAGGEFLATSVGGGNTGIGADIFMGDDLHKASEADSKARRDEAYNFFDASALTRLEGLKAIILIMQRLHEDDVVGRVHKKMKTVEEGGVYYNLSLPVINDYESLEKFYKWIERKNANAEHNLSEAEEQRMQAMVSEILAEEMAVYDVQNPKAIKPQRRKYEIKREKFHAYKCAREVYIETRNLPSTIVRYRDMAVERPPLTPLDEEEFGLDDICAKFSEMSKVEFKRQYMQDAKISEAGHFKKEHYREITDLEMPEQYKYIIVDPAESEEAAADDRAIGVYGKSVDESQIVTTVLLDGRKGKWDVYGTADKIIEMMVKYSDAAVLIEGAGGGISLGKVLGKQILIYNAKAQAKGKPQIKNRVLVFKPDNQTSKNSRIKLIGGPLEHGYFFVHVGCDGAFKEQWKSEMWAFNPERKNNEDNCIDTTGLSYSRPECTAKRKEKPKPEKIRRHGKKHNQKTWSGV